MPYQSMNLCFGKIIAAEQRIEPDIKEETGELSVLQDKTSGTDILFILGHNEVDVVLLQMREGLDDAVWRHNRDVLQRQGFEAALF